VVSSTRIRHAGMERPAVGAAATGRWSARGPGIETPERGMKIAAEIRIFPAVLAHRRDPVCIPREVFAPRGSARSAVSRPLGHFYWGPRRVDASPTTELSSSIRPRVAFFAPQTAESVSIAPPARPRRAQTVPQRKQQGRKRRRKFIAVNFLKETRGKETSACPGGGQQVAENGGNERAVPKKYSTHCC
jgi:hypothetical protein